jgi:hypothetical protein
LAEINNGALPYPEKEVVRRFVVSSKKNTTVCACPRLDLKKCSTEAVSEISGLLFFARWFV